MANGFEIAVVLLQGLLLTVEYSVAHSLDLPLLMTNTGNLVVYPFALPLNILFSKYTQGINAKSNDT